MAVITLTLSFTPENLAEANAQSAMMSFAEKNAAIRGMRDEEFFLGEEKLSRKLVLTVPRAEGDDGLIYEDVEFVISDRYTVDGNLWVEGRKFRMNISERTRAALSLLGE